MKNVDFVAYILPHSYNKTTNKISKITFKYDNIVINSSLSTTISVLTLTLLLFIFIPEEWFNIVSLLTLILFRT